MYIYIYVYIFISLVIDFYDNEETSKILTFHFLYFLLLHIYYAAPLSPLSNPECN